MSRRMTKPKKWYVCLAKTQISLGIRPVWSESSLSTWRNIRPLTTYWVHSKDSDETWWMTRFIWVFAGPTSFCWFCCVAAHMSKGWRWNGSFRSSLIWVYSVWKGLGIIMEDDIQTIQRSSNLLFLVEQSRPLPLLHFLHGDLYLTGLHSDTTVVRHYLIKQLVGKLKTYTIYKSPAKMYKKDFSKFLGFYFSSNLHSDKMCLYKTSL